MMKPETVNGYPIIWQALTPGSPGLRAGRVILVDRGGEIHSRYVVAWQGYEIQEGRSWDREWASGHYFPRIEDAIKKFIEKASEWYR